MASDGDEWTFLKSLRPIVPCALSIGIAYSSLARRNQHPRITWMLITAPAILAGLLGNDFSWDMTMNLVFIRFMIIFVSHQSFLFNIVSQDELDAERKSWTRSRGPCGSKQGGEDGPSWLFAYKMLFNAHCFGTRWEIPPRDGTRMATSTVSADSSAPERLNCSAKAEGKRDAETVRSAASPVNSGSSRVVEKGPMTRRAFVLQRLGVVFCRYLALCIWYDRDVQGYMPDGQRMNRADYSPYNAPYFTSQLPCLTLGLCGADDPSYRYQTALRATVVRLHWFIRRTIPDHLLLSAYHDILAMIFVCSGLDRPEEWPAFFGSVADAYTVRRYWAKYWQRLVYRSFSAHAAYFVHDILRLPRGVISRYLKNVLVFVISGLMHYAVAWLAMPETCAAYGCGNSFWLWPIQVLGMMVESLVQLGYGHVERSLGLDKRGRVLSNAMKRAIGYCWVVCWIMWTAEVIDAPFVYRITSGQVAPSSAGEG